jgi:hypothetical protein
MTDQKESANPKEGGRGINATGLVHSPSNSMAHSNESSGDVVSTKMEGTDDPFDDGEEDEDEDDEDDTDRPLSPMPSPVATNKPSRFVLPTPGGPVCAATEGNNGAAARSSPSTDVPTNINILAMQHNNTSGNNNSHTTAVTTATTATAAATTAGTTTTTTTATAFHHGVGGLFPRSHQPGFQQRQMQTGSSGPGYVLQIFFLTHVPWFGNTSISMHLTIEQKER